MNAGDCAGALRRRACAAVQAVLAKTGFRVVAADALGPRLAATVTGRQIAFPPAGVADRVVALRPLRATDAAVLSGFTAQPPAAWLDEQATLNEAGLALDLAVVERVSGAMVGLVQLQRFDWPNHRASVGLWLQREARGQGLMTHALTLLVAWVFEEGLLDRIEYLAQTDNTLSMRLAERCGFIREGELRSCLVMDRCRHDAVLLAALRGEWQAPDEIEMPAHGQDSPGEPQKLGTLTRPRGGREGRG